MSEVSEWNVKSLCTVIHSDNSLFVMNNSVRFYAVASGEYKPISCSASADSGVFTIDRDRDDPNYAASSHRDDADHISGEFRYLPPGSAPDKAEIVDPFSATRSGQVFQSLWWVRSPENQVIVEGSPLKIGFDNSVTFISAVEKRAVTAAGERLQSVEENQVVLRFSGPANPPAYEGELTIFSGSAIKGRIRHAEQAEEFKAEFQG